jgi:hypothetical protein
MKNYRWIALLLVLATFPMWMGATTVLKSHDLAPHPVSGDILTSADGKVNEWVNRTTVCCDLDEAYDAGNTIDYTGATTLADAILLTATTANNPDEFIIGFMDGAGVFDFGTNGYLGLNLREVSTGDFRWFSENQSGTPALFCDASADAVSLVGTEFYSDCTTTYIEHLLACNEYDITGKTPHAGDYLGVASVSGDTAAVDWITPPAVDTNTQVYSLSAAVPLTITTSYAQFGLNQPVLQAGTALSIGVTVSTWTVATGADTLSVALYIDGGIQGLWTTNAGATGSFSSALVGGTNTVTAATSTVSHTIAIFIKRTKVGNDDTIAVSVGNVLVQIV